MSYQATDFIDFVRRAPTAFHAVSEMSRMLENAGFARLNECEAWQLAPGGRYYLTRNGSALLALRVPETLAVGLPSWNRSGSVPESVFGGRSNAVPSSLAMLYTMA